MESQTLLKRGCTGKEWKLKKKKILAAVKKARKEWDTVMLLMSISTNTEAVKDRCYRVAGCWDKVEYLIRKG